MLKRILRENIRLDLALAPSLGSVRADVSQLHNVLINLVINAADALPDGGVIRIETRNVELDANDARAHAGGRPGPHVLLAVIDDGCGMDHATLDMIFEPFFTTKEIYAGTGLGLATVDGIVKQHQGSIDVESEPGHGSVFKVYLPRIEDRPEPLPDPDTPPRLHGKERILVVEDDAAVRNLASRALAKYGYTIAAASTPAEVLDMLKAGLEPCRLLLSDVVMPGMNGVQLHRTLQEVWPGVPVLFMSGYTSNVIVNHGILAEGLHFIQKPFTPRDLAAKVREVLDG
jgi:two-component system, cell cycle sensor histidine kinase and response regulator CckA